MRRRIFLHFVDHEILNRMAEGSTESALVACERLIRVASVISVEPALFPISAHHEERGMSELLRRLVPLIKSDLIRITGYGANPRANLELRREQFRRDRGLFSPLFSAAQDLLVQEFGDSWVEKQGSTTYAIRGWWKQNAPLAHGPLASLWHTSRPLTDSVLAKLAQIPDTLNGRPILANVVLGTMGQMDSSLVSDSLHMLLRADLGAALTRLWAEIYCDSLSATLFRDLGPGVPELGIFAPTNFSTISARESFLALAELGTLDSILNLPIPALARTLDDLRVERDHLSRDVLFRLTSGDQQLLRLQHLEVMSYYKKQRKRRSLWLGGFAGSWSRGSMSEVRKRQFELARALESYSNALGLHSQKWRTGMDRSFHISNITGDVNVAQDSASLQTVRVTSASLSDRLSDALESESTARQFVDWLTSNNLVPQEQVSSEEIRARIDSHELTEERKSLLRQIGKSLALSGTSSGVIVAVMDAIKSIAG